MRKGFTIVELLMVIGIIGVLLGMVTTAASESVRSSRQRKAQALCRLVEAGFSNFYAQYDRWPGPVGDRIANGGKPAENGSNNEGANGQDDKETVELKTSDVDDCIRAMIEETKKGNPVMDISGLFVSNANNVEPIKENCRCRASTHYLYKAANGVYGMDFMAAIHGTKRSPKKMSTKAMHFGYPHPDNGRFMPFRILYSIPTDSFKVHTWHWPGSDE